jgi:hypothetical protein
MHITVNFREQKVLLRLDKMTDGTENAKGRESLPSRMTNKTQKKMRMYLRATGSEDLSVDGIGSGSCPWLALVFAIPRCWFRS